MGLSPKGGRAGSWRRPSPPAGYAPAHPHKYVAAFLYVGFTQGFQIPYTGPRVAMDCTNLKPSRALLAVVAAKIEKECRAGRVAGLFPSPPIHNLRVSLWGLVPKKAAGEFRLIHQLSYPKGASVNDVIAPDLCSVPLCLIGSCNKYYQILWPRGAPGEV